MSVSLSQISFRYSDSEHDALRTVSAELEAGAATLVTGGLGAGCSTLLLVVAGLAPRVTGGVRSGEVTTLGHDPGSTEGRQALAGRVGLLLPTPWTQLSGMSDTVRDEIAFGPANLGWTREHITDAVERAMIIMRVENLALRDPRTLSGGELQRVMFAAVVAMDPEVLLFDEPAIELDPASARALYDLLPDLAIDKTVVIATTDVDRAADVAGRVLLLDRGRLVADGVPKDVLGAAATVSMGCGTTVAGIMRAAGAKPIYPHSVAAAVRYLRQ